MDYSRYIYTEHVELKDVEQACELSYVATKYMVAKLVEKCSDYMCSHVTPSIACQTFEYANLLEDVKLKVHISLFSLII